MWLFPSAYPIRLRPSAVQNTDAQDLWITTQVKSFDPLILLICCSSHCNRSTGGRQNRRQDELILLIRCSFHCNPFDPSLGY
jgi:hypothetical protein